MYKRFNLFEQHAKMKLFLPVPPIVFLDRNIKAYHFLVSLYKWCLPSYFQQNSRYLFKSETFCLGFLALWELYPLLH